MLVELTADETTCSICCSKFSSDTNNTDDKIRRHLPVLSSSKCDHWFCHGCVLREQQRVAGNNNGRVPKWLKCMTCRENTSFRPDEPKYHRLLIDLLGRAQRYASVQVKLEQECKIISPVCSETDEAEGRESKANVKGQSELGLFSSESPKHGNRLEQDSQPCSRHLSQVAAANIENLTSVDQQNHVQLREDPELIDREPFRSNSGNEFTEETIDAKPSNEQFTFQLERVLPVDLDNHVKVEAVPDPMTKEPPEGNNRSDSIDEWQSDLSLEGEEMNESSQNSREQLLVQLMKNLQSHVTSSDAEYAAKTIDEMLGYTDLMTSSFISQYPLGRTIKSARKAFGKSCPEIKMKCKTLSSEMRRINCEKESKDGAQPNKKRMIKSEGRPLSKKPRVKSPQTALAYTDEAKGRESSEANVEGQCAELGLFSSDSPKHGNRLEQDSQPCSRPLNQFATANIEDNSLVDQQSHVQLGVVPELIDREPFGSNRANEFTEETQQFTFQLGDFPPVDSERESCES